MVGDPKKVFYKDFGVETSLGFMSLKAPGFGMRRNPKYRAFAQTAREAGMPEE